MINNYSFRCPKCGSTNTVYDTSVVLTSNPPKYECKCRDCNEIFYSSDQATSKIEWTNKDSLDDMWKHDQSILNIPKIADPIPGESWIPMKPSLTNPVALNYGWVCPKCGRVLAPHKDYCDCSFRSNITVDTHVDPSTAPYDRFKYSTQSVSYSGGEDIQIKAISNQVNKFDKEAMKQKFIDESDSVFEAVDKYKEWEANLNKISNCTNQTSC